MNTHEANSKNLIFGLVKSYPFEKIKPFLESLKQCGYDGDICFLYTELSRNTIDSIKEYGVKLQPFNELYFNLPIPKNGKWQLKKIDFYHRLVNLYPLNRLNYWLVKSLTSNKDNEYIAKSRIASLFVHFMCVRFPLYYLYLSQYGQHYSNVMLTDVRDVLFQRDPFDFDIGNNLCCFFEDEGKTLGNGGINSEWLKKGFGNHVIDEIGDRKISCAGTTIGSRSAIMNYLEAMIDNMIELKCHLWGIDQGVHNYILNKGFVKNVKFYDNHHGPILTMHFTTADKLHFDDNGFILNEDGSVINVLHQYDRQSPEIKSQITVYRTSGCTY